MKKISIIGNVGKDANSQSSKSGITFATFTVAVNEKVKGKDETTWIEIVCFDKLADIAIQYIKKGMQVYLEGNPSVNAYINKSGVAVGTLSVIAHTIKFFGSKTEQHEKQQSDYNDETPF